MKGKHLSAVLIVALMIAVGSTACPPPPRPCQNSQPQTDSFIPDPKLEAILRERTHTQYAALEPADLESVFVIDASRFFDGRSPCIYNLEGLQYAVNLSKLDLRWNAISDISPLLENPGLGSGDTIMLEYNKLDVSPGSKAMEAIEALKARGANVSYIPQWE